MRLLIHSSSCSCCHDRSKVLYIPGIAPMGPGSTLSCVGKRWLLRILKLRKRLNVMCFIPMILWDAAPSFKYLDNSYMWRLNTWNSTCQTDHVPRAAYHNCTCDMVTRNCWCPSFENSPEDNSANAWSHHSFHTLNFLLKPICCLHTPARGSEGDMEGWGLAFILTK